MRALPPSRRNRIRRAQALGLSCEVDHNIERFYRVHSRNQRDLGTPVYPQRYFDTLLKVFQDDLGILSVVRHNEVLSSVISFYFRDQVLPYYAGGTNEARRTSANDFMYWELMRFARQRGATLFDFGRSRRGTGAFDYKTYWGFLPQPLHYEYFLLRGSDAPNVSPANPKYASVIACWKRLPLPVANWLGPYISRSLG
jgi:FemAB-related protein (PEP-CTERM system-associated)